MSMLTHLGCWCRSSVDPFVAVALAGSLAFASAFAAAVAVFVCKTVRENQFPIFGIDCWARKNPGAHVSRWVRVISVLKSIL